MKAYRQIYAWGRSEEYYYLTLEAVDAEVVKTYQAIFCVDCPDFELCMFGLVADNATRSLLKLIDERVVYGALDIRGNYSDHDRLIAIIMDYCVNTLDSLLVFYDLSKVDR